MPAVSAADAPSKASSNAVRFGAKAYTDPREVKAIFNRDLLTRGVLPVYLAIDNDGRDEIELLRARAQLLTASGQSLSAIAADAATTGQGRNAVSEAVFLFGIFSYDDANKFNDEMKRDWAEKGFGEVAIVGPGRTISKFLYFNVGKGFTAAGSKLTLTYTTNSARVPVSIPLR